MRVFLFLVRGPVSGWICFGDDLIESGECFAVDTALFQAAFDTASGDEDESAVGFDLKFHSLKMAAQELARGSGV